MNRAFRGARQAIGGRGRAAAARLVPVALLVARTALGVTHPSVVVLCGGSAAGTSVACRAYVSAFSSVAYPVEMTTPERWERPRDTIVVVPGVAAAALPTEVSAALVRFVEAGGKLVTALDTPLARALGVSFAGEAVTVTGVVDAAAPELEIRWRLPAEMRPFAAPPGAAAAASVPGGERPLVVAFPRGRGRVLFLGVELDEENPLGTSRFPYFLQAVGDAFDVRPPLASAHLVAYADLGDHKGQEAEAVAAAWARRGIREVHLGTWDASEGERRYERLIAACHRRGILVYAWFELPHVGRAFWEDHPEWRETTATGDDAHVDWRRLMALSVPECFQAVAGWMTGLLARLDWDGADLAEVYFESPLGLDRPDLFTPMSRAVRDAFRTRSGLDPKELFDERSPHFFRRDAAALEAFLAFRRDAAVELHERLLRVLAGVRERKPHLDVVVTLVDALYDATMRDRLGIDAGRIAALGARFPFELQLEDPFTLWTLGPERYSKIAADYAGLVAPGQRLAVDVNVVPRGDAVRPTAQQTGLELYRLLAEARRSFPKVCVYSEATVYRQDRAFVPSALAAGSIVDLAGDRRAVVSSDGATELATGAPDPTVRLDGRAWPAVRDGVVLTPRGRHEVEWGERGALGDRLRLLAVTGTLLDAAVEAGSLVVRYSSASRAYLHLSFAPARVKVDGARLRAPAIAGERGFVLPVPSGTHVVRLAP